MTFKGEVCRFINARMDKCEIQKLSTVFKTSICHWLDCNVYIFGGKYIKLLWKMTDFTFKKNHRCVKRRSVKLCIISYNSIVLYENCIGQTSHNS